MKYVLTAVVTLTFFLAGASLIAVAGEATPDQPKVTHEIPIAAGIYYPSDGPLPDKPMRYYRVRCWPGCHTGSSLGKYPKKELKDKPIFKTSTIDRVPSQLQKTKPSG